MKKTIFVGMALVCGCLAAVDPQEQPLSAGSRILGVNMSGSVRSRDGYDATYGDVLPELGFLFADNLALVFTPFYYYESQEGGAKWGTGGLMIAGDYTFYQPGKNVHPFASAHIGFAKVNADDGLGTKDDAQGFVLGGGGGVRMFHSSHCSVDLAVRYTAVTAELQNLGLDSQGDFWFGLSAKLYFPVQRVVQTR